MTGKVKIQKLEDVINFKASLDTNSKVICTSQGSTIELTVPQALALSELVHIDVRPDIERHDLYARIASLNLDPRLVESDSQGEKLKPSQYAMEANYTGQLNTGL